MMADGQLTFWAAGKLAYESEAWPQALVFVLFCWHHFLGKQQKLNVLTKNRLKIAWIRRKSLDNWRGGLPTWLASVVTLVAASPPPCAAHSMRICCPSVGPYWSSEIVDSLWCCRHKKKKGLVFVLRWLVFAYKNVLPPSGCSSESSVGRLVEYWSSAWLASQVATGQPSAPQWKKME